MCESIRTSARRETRQPSVVVSAASRIRDRERQTENQDANVLRSGGMFNRRQVSGGSTATGLMPFRRLQIGNTMAECFEGI